MTDPAPAPPDSCANCGAARLGPFCHACGQKSEPLRLAIRHVAHEAFTEFLDLDGRFWRTLGTLLVRPGTLTIAFAAGRRTRYLRPLRVYLTSTLLFFFVLNLLDPAGKLEGAIQADADSTATVAARLADVDAALARPPAEEERVADSLSARLEALAAALDSAETPGVDMPAERAEALRTAQSDLRADIGTLRNDGVQTDAGRRRDARRRLVVERAVLGTLPPDSLIRPADVERAASVVFPDTADLNVPVWLSRSETVAAFRNAGTDADRIAAGSAFARAAIGKVPTVMFLLLPLFALLLKALYARRGWYYAEHLVFGLHTHAFAFVVFTAVAGLASIGSGWAGALSLGLTLLIPIYFVVAQKRVYGQSWRKTLAKALLLSLVYNTVLTFGLVAAFALAAADP